MVGGFWGRWHITIITGSLSLLEALSSSGHEKVGDSSTASGISLEVCIAAIARAPSLGLLLGNLTLLITLVANDDEWELSWVLWRGLVKEICLPEVQALESGLIADIKGKDT